MAQHKYDPALRNTECGKNLYNIWRRVRRNCHCEAWDYFPTFYEWAIRNEYKLGAWLRRDDDNKPFTEENCFWYVPITQDCLDKWNETVNRIRKYYGMPPLEGTEYGD